MSMIIILAVALKLGSPFTDHAVLQRDQPVPVWGFAAPNATVTVSFAGQSVSATADAEGRWQVTLAPMPASKTPRDLTVEKVKSKSENGKSSEAPSSNQTIQQSNNQTILHDLLVGDVWLASGQSNMEMPLWEVKRKRFRDKMGGLVRQWSSNANFRVMMTYPERGVSPVPRTEYPVAWTVPNEEWLTTNRFSALAYHFGRELVSTLDVPVGVMCAAWGGTEIGFWVPDCGWEAVKDDPFVATNVQKRIERRKDSVKRRKWPEYPGDLWNEQVNALAPYGVKGLIWYQGESDIRANAARQIAYSKNMKALLVGWREKFEQPKLTCLFVELAPFFYPWQKDWGLEDESLALLRDEQQKFADADANAYMANISDLGDVNDIHPSRKLEVGLRLAALAFSHVYGMNVRADAPRGVSAKLVAPGKVEISLAHARGLYRWSPDVSLWTTNQHEVSPIRFVAADGKVVDCETEIVGEKIVATSKTVLKPAYVTHLRRRTDESNIYNDSALPLGTFKLEVCE